MGDDTSSPYDALLERLIAGAEIHAAAVADADGTIRRRMGRSEAIRVPESEDTSAREDSSPEDVYLETLEDDLLIVAFDAERDIDDVRGVVEAARRACEM